MADKPIFREAADSITQWMDRNKELSRQIEAERTSRANINRGSMLESARDTIRDLKEGVAALWDTMGTDRKFLQEYNLRSGKFEESWKQSVSKTLGYENFGFRMASGWELPKGVLYNGKLSPDQEGKKIGALTAVFLRRKDGQMEVLDHHDARYADLVVPYLMMQLIVPSAAGKAFGALSIVSKGTRAAEVTKNVADAAGKAWSVADNASGLYLAGTQVSSNFMLKPEAIRRLARLMDNPQSMTIDALREEVNKAFTEYSYKDGPLSEQYYVPSINPNESPLPRLNDLARGSLRGIYKVTTPFEKVGYQHFVKDESLTEVRNAIREDLYFQRSYFRLASKALSGARLSDQEKVLLSFGTRIFTGIADEEVTPTTLPEMLAGRMGVKRGVGESDAQYAGNIKQKLSEYQKYAEDTVKKNEDFEKQKAMAQGMAFAIH